ncbi:conserved hypothetical protein [Candida dubliniensis CD36]|uniref:Mediator of RNA polymerase II transcription subunit 9 n=1 Tax=Candida dubliniensis (strain CD36 / ATCC MYA-646 / CBS 7987 / NCPF 3949 / NRRL Y-17841) TaxID=573826 RepID=B9WJX0_CANDC|nr:conserved hypothetical protein [Candida dubliniensis CD36]CAX40927.1 conserved hypothetical protein [Candida dubliniensis CD36]
MSSPQANDSNSKIPSPMLSNDTSMLGDINIGAPIDITIDNSVIQQSQQQDLSTNDNMEVDDEIKSEIIPTSNELDPDQIEVKSEQPEQFTQETEPEIDPIEKMRSLEILPDLFNLLYDLNNEENSSVTPKDFDKYLGSLRLKLSNLKNLMQEVEGINETLTCTLGKIESLKQNNVKKETFLQNFKNNVSLNENI